MSVRVPGLIDEFLLTLLPNFMCNMRLCTHASSKAAMFESVTHALVCARLL